jgi:hypothetical protein
LKRRWLVVLLAVPLNGLAAVAVHAGRPRFGVVVFVSLVMWAVAGLAAPSSDST